MSFPKMIRTTQWTLRLERKSTLRQGKEYSPATMRPAASWRLRCWRLVPAKDRAARSIKD
ncbi:MAG: hypothetical protein EBW71_12460 [Betaproteobacteria bacterium]|nr:hypothetical protein [Betaproteobacteria bacterium]